MNDDGGRLILRDDRIIETIVRLNARISDRFPGSGLSELCVQLLEVARQASQRATWIGRPIRWIRVLGYAIATILLFCFVALIVYELQPAGGTDADTGVAVTAVGGDEKIGVLELVAAFDSGANAIIALSLAIFFLVSLETRIKRRRALTAIHELRSIAHVVDMHQLTKDPERFLRGWSDSKHSPKQTMTPFQLNRYLDYCSEMLSLIGKIAALYVQQFNDAEAVAAVSEVEQLSTGLSRKIWQKIMILQQTLRDSSPGDHDRSQLRPLPVDGPSNPTATRDAGSPDPPRHDTTTHDPTETV